MKSDAFRDGVERLDLDDTLAQMSPSVVLRGPSRTNRWKASVYAGLDGVKGATRDRDGPPDASYVSGRG
jgi:hypothetical protein